MIITLVFLAITLFCAKQAIRFHEEEGKKNWFWILASVGFLIGSVLVAVKPFAD